MQNLNKQGHRIPNTWVWHSWYALEVMLDIWCTQDNTLAHSDFLRPDVLGVNALIGLIAAWESHSVLAPTDGIPTIASIHSTLKQVHRRGTTAHIYITCTSTCTHNVHMIIHHRPLWQAPTAKGLYPGKGCLSFLELNDILPPHKFEHVCCHIFSHITILSEWNHACP